MYLHALKRSTSQFQVLLRTVGPSCVQGSWFGFSGRVALRQVGQFREFGLLVI